MIKVFTQGLKEKDDQELFGLVGRWLVDVKIHQQLGTAITSNDGDVWFVSIPEKGSPRGFANGRLLKNGKFHIRFVYCVEGSPMICEAMIKKFLNEAAKQGSKEIYTNDIEVNQYWSDAGFEFTPPARGRYGKWIKQLGE